MKRYPRAFSWILALAIAFASEIGWAQELEKVVIGHSSLRLVDVTILQRLEQSGFTR